MGIITLSALAMSLQFGQGSSFQQNNEYWTYRDGNWMIHGILVHPSGPGPFPAIIVSHGKGGTAETFARSKAEEFKKWGMVTIAVDYTHSMAGGATTRNDDRYSKENMKRAMKALDLLKQQPYVDSRRIAAYGNSMGAFLTIGLAAEPRAGLKAAIITAGGLSSKEGYPAPTADVAKKIRVPFLIIHGENDTTVPPDRSIRLKDVLDENKVENERKTYPGEGHNVHQTRSKEVYEDIKNWLIKYKVLGS